MKTLCGVALLVLACSGAPFSAEPAIAEGEAGLGGAIGGGAGGSPSMRPIGGKPATSAGAPAGLGGESGAPEEPAGGGEPPTSAGAGGESTMQPVNECPCAAPTPSCVAGKCVARGPGMTKAGAIYIDRTEVTVGQYDAFLAAKGSDVSGQAAECSWNDSFEPSGPKPTASHPVTNVDFCDAAAFCAWADKRLCGKLGGGKLQTYELPDGSKSEWFSACAGPKGQPYPYGVNHLDGACNDSSGSGAIAPVGSFAACTGAYPGLYDMVGNVAEWVDACDASKDGWDGCETIGGSFADELPCTGSGLRHRDQKEPSLGFRCCGQ